MMESSDIIAFPCVCPRACVRVYVLMDVFVCVPACVCVCVQTRAVCVCVRACVCVGVLAAMGDRERASILLIVLALTAVWETR